MSASHFEKFGTETEAYYAGWHKYGESLPSVPEGREDLPQMYSLNHIKVPEQPARVDAQFQFALKPEAFVNFLRLDEDDDCNSNDCSSHNKRSMSSDYSPATPASAGSKLPTFYSDLKPTAKPFVSLAMADSAPNTAVNSASDMSHTNYPPSYLNYSNYPNYPKLPPNYTAIPNSLPPRRLSPPPGFPAHISPPPQQQCRIDSFQQVICHSHPQQTPIYPLHSSNQVDFARGCPRAQSPAHAHQYPGKLASLVVTGPTNLGWCTNMQSLDGVVAFPVPRAA